MSPIWRRPGWQERAPGQLISIGTHRLHLSCAGTGVPPVVFDAALAGSVLSWTFVQPEIAKLTRACAYDRAGHGWSDAGPLPRTLEQIAAELHELLHAAGVPPPFVLVGHSYGGLVVRVYAAQYPDEVCGLVLVDPAHPKDWVTVNDRELRRLEAGVTLCRRGAVAAHLGLARLVSVLVSLGALRVARACVGLVGGGMLHRAQEEIIAPVYRLPAAQRSPLKHMWTRPEFFQAVGSQIETIRDDAARFIDKSERGYGNMPLAVISASNPEPSRRYDQDKLAALSSRGRHFVAVHSGHWVPLDEPETVIQAIRYVLDLARQSAPDR